MALIKHAAFLREKITPRLIAIGLTVAADRATEVIEIVAFSLKLI